MAVVCHVGSGCLAPGLLAVCCSLLPLLSLGAGAMLSTRCSGILRPRRQAAPACLPAWTPPAARCLTAWRRRCKAFAEAAFVARTPLSAPPAVAPPRCAVARPDLHPRRGRGRPGGDLRGGGAVARPGWVQAGGEQWALRDACNAMPCLLALQRLTARANCVWLRLPSAWEMPGLLAWSTPRCQSGAFLIAACHLCNSNPAPGSHNAVAQVCRVERNPSVFASNWVPLWAGAVDPGSVEVGAPFVGMSVHCGGALRCGAVLVAALQVLRAMQALRALAFGLTWLLAAGTTTRLKCRPWPLWRLSTRPG